MGWWGTAIGGAFGFMIGGPLGAIIGASFGHNFDKGMTGLGSGFQSGDQQRVQTVFFSTTFAVMGYIAKADGHVSASEIKLAEQVMTRMQLDAEMRETARKLFAEGKKDDFQLDEVIGQFRKECHRRQTLIQMFMEIQIQAALADGSLDAAENAVLERICQILRFPLATYRQLVQMLQAGQSYHQGSAATASGPSLSDAYIVLGMKETNTDAEIKKAYRRLMSQHHPDKLVSKGLPEEMIKLATEKTQDIRKAYEVVKAAR